MSSELFREGSLIFLRGEYIHSYGVDNPYGTVIQTFVFSCSLLFLLRCMFISTSMILRYIRTGDSRVLNPINSCNAPIKLKKRVLGQHVFLYLSLVNTIYFKDKIQKHIKMDIYLQE